MNVIQNTMLQILVLAIFLDIITGVAKSVVWKITDSSVSIKGITKHAIVIIIFVVLYIVVAMLDGSAIGNMVNIGAYVNAFNMCYIGSYLLSVLENLGVMGIWYPEFLKTRVESEIEGIKTKIENGTVE